MKLFSLIIFCISLVISQPIFAHAGHDHASNLASLIHLAWLAPALIAVALLYTKLLKKNYQIKTNNSK